MSEADTADVEQFESEFDFDAEGDAAAEFSHGHPDCSAIGRL